MDKKEYKKALVDIRNSYIDYKKSLDDQLINILGISFDKQKQYLDNVSFNLISKENVLLSNIGNLIAYKIFKKRTNKDLIDISTEYFIEYDKVQEEIKRSNIELNKIASAIDFINSIDNKELDKYLQYKIN